MIEEKQIEIIEKTAQMLAGNYANIENTLSEAMIEISSHHQHSGGHPHHRWVAALESFGQILIAISKREKSKCK